MQKRFLILVCLLVHQMCCQAQVKTDTMVDTLRTWSVVGHTSTGGPPPYVYTTDFYTFTSDTILDLKTYRQVYVTDDPAQSNWSLIGFIREEVDQKVYYRGITDTTEGLLYDFQVIPGDSIHIVNALGMAVDLEVLSVDSSFIYNRYVKRINFGFETWYEGLGSSCGILYSGSGLMAGYQFELLCYFENDTLKYSNPLYSSCYIDSTIVGINERTLLRDNEVKFFPNPTTGFFSIKLPLTFGTLDKFEIYNPIGQTVGRFDKVENADINEYPRGLYFVALWNEKGERMTGKVVKE